MTHDLVHENNRVVDEVMQKLKTNPDNESFFNAVDFVNTLIILLYSRDVETFKHCNCEVPDAYAYLEEYLGYEDITDKVNKAQDGLIKAIQRQKKTGSYALDGDTLRLLDEVVEMYKAVIEIMPIRTLHDTLSLLKSMGDKTTQHFLHYNEKKIVSE